MSNYKDKHLIDGSAPDHVDLDDCPVYQAYLKQCDEARLKQQMQDELKGDINEYFERTSKATSST
jgi:hypothetical protein